MFARVSNTLLGETTLDHYFTEYKRMRLTWHVAIIQEDIDVIHTRKVSRRGARYTYSTYLSGKPLNILGRQKIMNHSYNSIALSKKYQENIYKQASITEATQF